MKKITAVAIAVLVATQANATEVYKNEKGIALLKQIYRCLCR